ncbi:MAG: CHASE domain-containing protein, partial [Lysobacter sp.]
MTTTAAAPRHPSTPPSLAPTSVRLSVIVPIAVFAMGLAAAGVLGLRQHDANTATIGAAIDAVADEASNDLQRRMKFYEYGLRGARGAVPGDGRATPGARQRYTEYVLSRAMDEELLGARGFGYVQRVTPAREAAFVAEQREGGSREFSIHELAPNDGERFVITYIEPLPRNRPALGLDLASDPTRREAALAALASGRPTLTGPIKLVQTGAQTGYSMLMLLPVYRGGATPDPARRAALSNGWVVAPLASGEFLNGSGMFDRSYSLQLLDVTDSARPVLLNASPPQAEPASEAFDRRRQMSLYGRRWELVIQPGKALVAKQQVTSALTVA